MCSFTCVRQASLVAVDDGAGRTKKRRKRGGDGELGVALCQKALRLPVGDVKAASSEAAEVRLLGRLFLQGDRRDC